MNETNDRIEVVDPVVLKNLGDRKLNEFIPKLWLMNILASTSSHLFVANSRSVLCYVVEKHTGVIKKHTPFHIIEVSNDVHYIRIGKMFGRDVLVIICDDGIMECHFIYQIHRNISIKFKNKEESSWSCSVSPNLICVGSNGHYISAWNYRTFKHFRIDGCGHNIPCIDFSSCGNWLCAASIDKTVRMFRVYSERNLSVMRYVKQPNRNEWGWSVRFVDPKFFKIVKNDEYWSNEKPEQSSITNNTNFVRRRDVDDDLGIENIEDDEEEEQNQNEDIQIEEEDDDDNNNEEIDIGILQRLRDLEDEIREIIMADENDEEEEELIEPLLFNNIEDEVEETGNEDLMIDEEEEEQQQQQQDDDDDDGDDDQPLVLNEIDNNNSDHTQQQQLQPFLELEEEEEEKENDEYPIIGKENLTEMMLLNSTKDNNNNNDLSIIPNEFVIFTTKFHIYLLDNKLQVLDSVYYSPGNILNGLPFQLWGLRRLSLIEYVKELALILVASQASNQILLLRLVTNNNKKKYRIQIEGSIRNPEELPICGFSCSKVTKIKNREKFTLYAMFYDKKMMMYEISSGYSYGGKNKEIDVRELLL